MALFRILLLLHSPLLNLSLYSDLSVKQETNERNYCYITSLHTENNKLFIKADFIQFLRGKEAIDSARQNKEAEYNIDSRGDTTYFVLMTTTSLIKIES